MKIKILAIIMALLLLAGCTSSAGEAEDSVFEISERFFSTQFVEIFLNVDDFIGRTIRYEGIFEEFNNASGEHFYVVFRYIVGCCGIEGHLGLELILNDIEPLPDGTWTEVSGILAMHEEGGQSVLRLDVISLVELDTRGLEAVPGL